MGDISGKWFVETIFPELATMLRVQRVIYSGRTEYQEVEVLESSLYGRSLVLDGKTQSTERDEHIYHEALVHPSMLLHPNPRTVFIGGGGEGGTLREVLSHKSVERVVMVDLDAQVVELCREYLPQHHQGSFDDPRLELRHEDARGYLRDTSEQFDVMIMDLVDPMEGGPAYLLYTEEYYRIVSEKLRAGGVMVTQSGPAGLLALRECFTTIHKTLSGIFSHTLPCQIHVPAFHTLWGFNIASDIVLKSWPNASALDGLIADRITKPLKFYDGETHTSMFSLPKFIRDGIMEEQRINRDDDPVFMV